MEKIYFDKQIFSYLFKADEPVYKSFLSDLLLYKDKFLYCYSHGHLLDLKNDKTDIKYKELGFIETLVGDNYLSYHALKKKTSCYLAKPIDAFRDIEKEEEPISLSAIFDNLNLSSATKEQREQIEIAKELLTNQKFDFGIPQMQDIPDDISKSLSKILPVNLSSMTLMDWAEHFMNLLESMQEDKTVYKGLRELVDKHFNNGKFTVEYDSIDFNDDLKNSALQKSFIEYVNSNLNPNGKKKITNYDFFINAYFTLDLLGISKEPSKKVRFKNVMNDGYHSYYGAFCDYVISDDQGFLRKTKALYKLLGIETKVFHIDEFFNHFAFLTASFELDASSFFKFLNNDLINGNILATKDSIDSEDQRIIIEPVHQYLGYFNIIDQIFENGQVNIFLRRKTKNYSYFSFYREYEGLINYAIHLFGLDYESKGKFNWEKEIKEISEKKWNGRIWTFEDVTILIEINKGINEICLLIKPIA